MKVEQNINPINIKQINKNSESDNKIKKVQPSFGGAAGMVLRFLDTNPAWGADAVDLGCMVIPRTWTDFGRGPSAGFETMRREGMGTANHSSVPLYGALAGALVAGGINRGFGFNRGSVKANNVFADSETMTMMGKLYDAELKSAKLNPAKDPLKEFLFKYFNNYEALSPHQNGVYVKMSEDNARLAADILYDEIKTNGKKISKEGFNNARGRIMSALGGIENNFRIISEDAAKPHTSRYSVDTLIDNAYKFGKLFDNEKVIHSFENAADYAQNAFIKAMKNMNLKRSIIGVGIASVIGICAQPFNMYLTRKKTGQSGFVGGGGEDKSLGFKVKKTLAALAFEAFALSTIGNPKNLIQNIQFKGMNPTIKQFKFIYGITIFSRFLAARNNNELAEISVKDPLGFANWLILGNFVQKLVAQGLDKDLIKRDGNGIWKWVSGSVLKTRDEILHAALGEKAFKDGKALNYNQMVKLADKATKVKLGKLTVAQITNYLYSGLILGIGIPKLNIYLTGRREAKNAERAKAVAGSENTGQSANVTFTQNDRMLAASNIAFLQSTGVNFLN